jgi:hypothetical protein
LGLCRQEAAPYDRRRRPAPRWRSVHLRSARSRDEDRPAYLIGKRDLPTATAFLADLSDRLANRVQLSSDALSAYVDATERAFGADVDYGQIVKFYEAEPVECGRYSPPHVVGVERSVIVGNPDQAHISTSLIERQNLTMRMSMRRFTRLTNAFSKKIENLRAAVSLHFAHYNFVRVHRSLRITPAIEAGVSDRLWSIDELVERTSNRTLPLFDVFAGVAVWCKSRLRTMGVSSRERQKPVKICQKII